MTPPATQHGSSGASVYRLGLGAVRKSGPRAREQARWLRDHSSRAVVEVFHISAVEDWYTMEELQDIPWGYVIHEAILGEQVHLLHDYIWSYHATVPLDLEAHAAKVDGLTAKYLSERDAQRFREAREGVQWTRLTRCLTHGDPTIENVMLRGQEQLVLIDPIPATPAVPDLLVVDVGKMLQSAVGWESVRYGKDFRHSVDDIFRCITLDDHSWDAASYWCGVHLLRTLPYIDKSLHREVISLAVSALSGF